MALWKVVGKGLESPIRVTNVGKHINQLGVEYGFDKVIKVFPLLKASMPR
jgi:hypothetical protein